MDAENLDLILNTNGDYNMHSFASNEEMSSDLQKRLKRINKLTDGLYETKFKIDRYKFDRALKSTCSLPIFDSLSVHLWTSFGIL